MSKERSEERRGRIMCVALWLAVVSGGCAAKHDPGESDAGALAASDAERIDSGVGDALEEAPAAPPSVSIGVPAGADGRDLRR